MWKAQKSLDERLAESRAVREKHPDRIPVLCERHASSALKDVGSKKFLVPRDLTIGQFIYVLRKRMPLPSSQALFLSTESGHIPPSSQQMQQTHAAHQDEDGFLYLRYSGENTFGGIRSAHV